MKVRGLFLWSPKLNKLRIFYVPSAVPERGKPNGSGAGQTVPKGSMRYGAIRIAGNDRQKH